MNIKQLGQIGCCVAVVTLMSLSACQKASKEAVDNSVTSSQKSGATDNQHKKPNVLFILVDDLGIKDLSVEGSTYYETPNIDDIAHRGVRFTRGYAASRVCSPARASILTGKFVTNHGITTWIGDKHGTQWRARNRHDSHDPANYQQHLRAEEETLAEVFQSAGYQTFFAGKWHLGGEGSGPQDHGFEINKGGWHVGTPAGGYFSPYRNPQLADGPPGEPLTLRLAKETANFIGNHDSNKPFFAFLSFYAVHAPFQTTEALWQKYRDKAANQHLPGPRFEFDRRYAVRQKQDHPIFAGMVETMDTAVGIVVDKLKQTGQHDNTIVVFTSDNGGLASGDGHGTSVLPYRGGKGRQFEGGIRVPYYIYVPGMQSPQREIRSPVSGVDFYPTLLELTGIQPSKTHRVDGTSLVPVMLGQTLAKRPLFWHFPHYGNQGGEPASMILEGDWKLIYYHEDKRLELYQVARDTGEKLNVLDAEPQRAASMKLKLDHWLAHTHAKFPAENPDFDEAQRAARWQKLENSINTLEQSHQRYLAPDFMPNDAWWGSGITTIK